MIKYFIIKDPIRYCTYKYSHNGPRGLSLIENCFILNKKEELHMVECREVVYVKTPINILTFSPKELHGHIKYKLLEKECTSTFEKIDVSLQDRVVGELSEYFDNGILSFKDYGKDLVGQPILNKIHTHLKLLLDLKGSGIDDASLVRLVTSGDEKIRNFSQFLVDGDKYLNKVRKTNDYLQKINNLWKE